MLYFDTKVSVKDKINDYCLFDNYFRGSNHFHQSDLYFTAPTSRMPEIYSRPPLDPTVGHRVNSDTCLDFLRRFLLKGILEIITH